MNKTYYAPCTLHMKDAEGKKYLLTVERDNDPDDPTAMMVSHLVCFHRRYRIGEKHNWDLSELQYWLREHRDEVVVKPVYLMDHGIQSISTGPFGDLWDSGQIGYCYVMQNEIDPEHTIEDWRVAASELVESEVELYNQYLQGDVYYCTLEEQTHIYDEVKCPCCGETIKINERDDWEEIESCCGFYGDDLQENGIFDSIGHGLIVESEE